MDWTGLDSDSERLDDLHYSFENQLINMID